MGGDAAKGALPKLLVMALKPPSTGATPLTVNVAVVLAPLKLPAAAWVAVSVALPAPMMLTVEPLTMATAGLLLP